MVVEHLRLFLSCHSSFRSSFCSSSLPSCSLNLYGWTCTFHNLDHLDLNRVFREVLFELIFSTPNTKTTCRLKQISKFKKTWSATALTLGALTLGVWTVVPSSSYFRSSFRFAFAGGRRSPVLCFLLLCARFFSPSAAHSISSCWSSSRDLFFAAAVQQASQELHFLSGKGSTAQVQDDLEVIANFLAGDFCSVNINRLGWKWWGLHHGRHGQKWRCSRCNAKWINLRSSMRG